MDVLLLKKHTLFSIYFFLNHMYVFWCGHEHANAGPHRGQVPVEATATSSCEHSDSSPRNQMQVLCGVGLTLNPRATSPVQTTPFGNQRASGHD